MNDSVFHKRHAVHLKHPVQKMLPYITMRCGRMIHETKDTYNLASDPGQVTCTKCRGFIENPFRSLRRYGRLTIINDFSIVLSHDFGYKWDIVAVKFSPQDWNIFIGKDKKLDNHYHRSAENMNTAAFNILEIIEKNLIKK